MPDAETERGRGAGEKCRLASKQRRLWGQPGRAEISRRREGPGQLEEVFSTGAKQEPGQDTETLCAAAGKKLEPRPV